MPLISFLDIYTYARLKSDIWWIAVGERITDSIVRQAMPKDDGSMVSPKRGHFFLAHWSKSDVYAYIRHHRLKGFPHTWGSSQPHSHQPNTITSPTSVGGDWTRKLL